MSQYPDDMQLERRVGFEEWKKHVDNRLDSQDKKLDEILVAFRASKAGAHFIAWLSGVGAAVAVIWANFHNGK
jgi:hypothetical protein